MDATSRAQINDSQLGDTTPGAAPGAMTRRNSGSRWQPPMKIVDFYLLRHVIEATLHGLGWFAGLLVAFAIITALRRFAEAALTFSGMIELLAYQMPRIIVFTLPMSVLYGTVQTFADLSSKGEITALGVGGMSLPRMLRAPLIWGGLLGVVAFWLQETVVPYAEEKKTRVLAQQIIQAKGVQENFSMENRSSEGRTERKIQADRFDPRSKTLLNPVIQIYNPDGTTSVEIVAQRAEWNIERGKWKFYNGHTTVWPTKNKGPLSVRNHFETTELSVAPNPSMMGAKTISREQNLEEANYEMVSINDLVNYRARLMADRKVATPVRQRKIDIAIRSATFGMHDKIATPLICFALVLVAAPLGIRPQRSSGGFAMGLSLAVLLIYYITWTVASQVGKNGVANPYIAAYIALTLTTVIGVVLVAKKNR